MGPNLPHTWGAEQAVCPGGIDVYTIHFSMESLVHELINKPEMKKGLGFMVTFMKNMANTTNDNQ